MTVSNFSWCARFAIALSVALCFATLGERRVFAQSGVTAQFAKANKAFREGKTKAAYKQLVAIVKKYPDHQPSHLLLGRIMFKQGRVGKAAKHFKRVATDLIGGADVAYEYGVTMFQAKDCKRSSAGFGKVAPQSKYAGVANFYRGICALQSGDYDRAETLLSRAKKIPGNLESSRRRALSEARKRQREDRRGFAGAAPPIVAPPPPPVFVEPAAPPTAQGQAPKKPPPPPPPPTGLSTTVTPGLKYTQRTTNKDFHGFSTSRSEDRVSDLTLGLKFKYDAAPRPSGGQPYFSLGIDAAQSTSSSKGTTTEFIAYSTDPGTIIEQEKPITSTSTTLAAAKVNPEVGYPITGAVDITAGYSLAENYPDMKAEKKTGSRAPYGILDVSIDTLTLKGVGKQTENLGEGGKPSSTVLSLGGEVSKAFETVTLTLAFQQDDTQPAQKPAPGFTSSFLGVTQTIIGNMKKKFETVSLALGVSNVTSTPPAGYIAATEDSVLKVKVSLNKSFEFGGNIGLDVSMEKGSGGKAVYDQKPASGTPTPPPTTPPDPNAPPPVKDVVLTERSGQGVTLLFNIAPLDWLFASASYSQTTNAYTLNKPQYEFDFQKATPEIVSVFTISGGVSKSF